MRSRNGDLDVAVVGAGSVGMKVIEALDEGIPGCRLAAIAVRDASTASERFAHLRRKVPVLEIAELVPLADLMVECAPAPLFAEIAEPFLSAGKTVVALSAGAILSNGHLVDLARAHRGQLVVPTGALLGLDALTAAAEGQINSVRMVTCKPPGSLAGAPYLIEKGLDIANVSVATMIFQGSAREAAKGFPANLNVAAALSLAGIGPDRTELEIWVDPALDRSRHTIEVDADTASFSVRIDNVPSENPKTGRIAPLSAIAHLRKINAPLRVGT